MCMVIGEGVKWVLGVHNMSECVCGSGGYGRCWEGWGLRDRWGVNFWEGRALLYHGGENNSNMGQILREEQNVLIKCVFEFSGFSLVFINSPSF